MKEMNSTRKYVIFIIGVSGVGKSTIGNLLSEEMKIPYFDGDDYHSEENVSKMSKGIPLNDDDRQGWLESLNKLAKNQIDDKGCIIACSALREKYRDILSHRIEINVKWIFLSGSYDQVLSRIQLRHGHFMTEQLLKSQFETLEEPAHAFKINITLSPVQIVKKIENDLFQKSEFGIIGLGVMGKSLSRNLASKGINLSLYNRHVKDKEENVSLDFKNEYSELKNSKPFDDLEAFVNSIQQPRKIMLMVNAGKTVDLVIENLIPYLSEYDIIIDGGNSHFLDTNRRIQYLEKKGHHFIGCGVSGGEEGALKGPSIMPGGKIEAYKLIQPYLELIAARDQNQLPCCTYIGAGGSGHFIKTVHNGIEYAEMQLLAEVYAILSSMGLNPTEISNVLEEWKTTANSYLLEITVDILRKKDDKGWIIDDILDKAGNKGTGNWTTVETAKLGIPSTMIASALFSRYISSFKEERFKMEQLYSNTNTSGLELKHNDILLAYQLARIVNHHQGFKLLLEASKNYNWELNLSEIARIWTNGCIIRSDFMEGLSEINKKSECILADVSLVKEVIKMRPQFDKVIAQCILNQIPVPCLSEAANFLNAYTKSESSANMIQAQRDYFGAHTYQKKSDPSGKFYHTKW